MPSSCAVEPPTVYCSSHASVSSTSSTSSHSSMEKRQRHQPSTAAAAAAAVIAIDTSDYVFSPRLLDYSPTSATTLSTASDALRIAHEQLRKVYIAEASLLTNMEQCSSSLDLDHIMDGLRRLAVYEADIQRRLFCHVSFLSQLFSHYRYSPLLSTSKVFQPSYTGGSGIIAGLSPTFCISNYPIDNTHI
ncbi:unnamed protein product [Haemonchus placei]|uniref:Uncharacterized protein n=1 Tax=Haemonchus placei TaxID=6290 RepID=A0A0N4X8X7_HAEPC|nr:unnamed protein product [Haemonchus placei]